MIKVIFKWTKWCSISLVVLLLLITTALAGVLFTNPGLNLVLWGAEKALPQLKVASSQGSIFPKFSLNQVQFTDPNLNIDTKVDQLTLAVNPRCLVDPMLCVDEVAIQGLDFALTSLPESDPLAETEPSPPVTSVAMPLPIRVGKISLSDIQLDILGNKIDWTLFSTALKMNGDRLTIAPTLLNNLTVELAQTTDSEEVAETNAQEPATKQAIQLPEVWIPLNIDWRRFDLNRFTLVQETPVVVNHLGLEAKAGGNSVDIKTLEVDVPQATAKLSTQVELKDDYPLELSLSTNVKQTELSGQKLTLTASGSVADLSFDSNFSGVVEAALSGSIQPLEPTLPFDLKLTDGIAQWPLKGKSDYQVDISKLNTSGSLDGYILDLTTKIVGKQIPPLQVDVAGKGTLQQIDLESIKLGTLGGEVSGKVMANWQAPINWQADIALDNIQPGLQWPEAEGNISGTLQTSGQLTEAGGWQVELPVLNINGVLREYPLNIAGQLNASDVKADGNIKLDTQGLALSHGPNALRAKGALDQEWKMDVAVDFPDLAKSVPDLKGTILGDIHLKGAMKEPNVQLALNVNQLNWQNEAKVEKLSLKGNVTPLPHPQADLNLAVTNAQYQDNTIDSVALQLEGGEKEHRLTLDVVSNIVSTSLAISGSFTQSPEMIWDGQLERVKVTSQQGPWELQSPTALKVEIDKQQANVQAHCWQQAKSSVCLTEDVVAGKSGEAHLAVNQFDFEQVKSFLPKATQVQGSVDAVAYAKWQENTAPEVKVQVTLPKGQVGQKLEAPLQVGWESIAVNAHIKDNQLQADWLLDVTDNGDLSGRVMLPDVQAQDKQIDAQVSLSTFNLDFLKPLIGDYSLLEALLQTDLEVKGPLMHPQVFGQFSINEMKVKGDVTPIDVNGGKVELDFNGYSADLNAGIQTPDGELKVSGKGEWQDLKDWSTNVRVFAEELKVDLPPMVKIKLVPDMTIDVSPKLAKISGDIALPWGRIVVEELPPSAVGVSKDQVILNEDLEPVEGANTIPFEVETNVNISIGDDFLLSAFGLEGGLIGKLNVAQKDKGPFITGEVNIENGTYRSFGQDLIINEGKILMNGPADQPYVAISAIRNPDNTQDDVTAGVRVTGPASEPAVEIYSEPAMPQANALSYLLRGQDIDGESGGNSMTTTLIGLSLAKSGQVVGELGEAFGVQDLQLDTAGSGDDSQVTVSGYVLPGLQVKYGVGIFNSLGEFTVRYRLMQDLYVEAVSGLDSAVDLLYQFEFD
ncbi:translocation/assembly module TamB [Vibrio sp. T187]|uniref:autotransporter assembly complex protein TamB n=1 Tax=Vibrio TaxID=662 RepID=UPI0010C9DD82|nr:MULTISPECIES: translocation/assembly module TamB domain-containing protein [Vibrio]MBW3697448.1 translocation/assembly module TamB [Vibrio sp. T187]